MNCVKVDIKNNRTIFANEEIPKVESDEDVIVKVAYAGFCGTDIHIIKGEFTNARDGVILGHEVAGTIVNVSGKYSHLAIGDRVAVNPNLSCGICVPCKRLKNNFCKGGGSENAIGIVQNGGWAEYVKAHVSQVTKIPDHLSLEQAALCEPLSCIIHGLDKLHDLDMGSNILIIGAGIIGILWSCLLHALGHRNVIISSSNVKRRNVLSEIGLGYKCMSWQEILQYKRENPEYMADICIDCSGNSEAMQAALPLIENGGTLLIFGVAEPEKTIIINPFKVYSKEITVSGAVINTPNSFERAVSYIESMSKTYLKIEKLGIGTFSLNEHESAVNAFQKGSFTKIMFKV
ncbi:uncharacterized protein LOC135844243 [Planococcus citri]|uniref:uncharacterized protein LOC135844243 n=1 Tax=Planococcus citri TaxID=170843 RepID=UPI0031F72D72